MLWAIKRILKDLFSFFTSVKESTTCSCVKADFSVKKTTLLHLNYRTQGFCVQVVEGYGGEHWV